MRNAQGGPRNGSNDRHALTLTLALALAGAINGCNASAENAAGGPTAGASLSAEGSAPSPERVPASAVREGPLRVPADGTSIVISLGGGLQPEPAPASTCERENEQYRLDLVERIIEWEVCAASDDPSSPPLLTLRTSGRRTATPDEVATFVAAIEGMTVLAPSGERDCVWADGPRTTLEIASQQIGLATYGDAGLCGTTAIPTIGGWEAVAAIRRLVPSGSSAAATTRRR